MENDVPTAPAGWYPDTDGIQRYWDGSRWLEIPPPESGNGATKSRAPRLSKRTRLILVASFVVVLVAAGGGIAWKLSSDAQAAAIAEEKAEEKAVAAAKAEKSAKEAQERKDRDERASRKTSVAGIEISVKKMAEGHAADGLTDGPILDATCSPVGGGSTDDLTESTTVFECFVANKDNGDGTMSGYTYNATMNWSTGAYTYGIGSP